MKVYLVENHKGQTVIVFSDKGKALKYISRQKSECGVNYNLVERLVF